MCICENGFVEAKFIVKCPAQSLISCNGLYINNSTKNVFNVSINNGYCMTHDNNETYLASCPYGKAIFTAFLLIYLN